MLLCCWDPASTWELANKSLSSPLLADHMSDHISTDCQQVVEIGVSAAPVAMQCILGTRRYRDIFTEMYSVLAVIAGLCLIPTLLVLTRLARAF